MLSIADEVLNHGVDLLACQRVFYPSIKVATMIYWMFGGPWEYCFRAIRVKQPVLQLLIDVSVSKYGYAQVRLIYQHSPTSYTRIIKNISRILCRLHADVMKLPDPAPKSPLRDDEKA